jgi:hypothetical protein
MNLDWKWIGLGTLIMLALSILAGIILGLALGGQIGAQLEGGVDPADITLSGGQMAIVAVLNFLAFLVGGFIVGLKSAGKTIFEPAIAAAVAVAVGLLLSGGFTVTNLLAAGLVPFLAGLLGGWLGERRQESKAAP